MEKENYKIKKKHINTVKDFKDILDIIPEDYNITCTGISDFSLAVDEDRKYVLLDSEIYMSEEDFKDDTMEE